MALPAGYQSWGAMPAAFAGEAENAPLVRALYMANEIMPWLDPVAQKQAATFIRDNLESLRTAWQGATGVPNVDQLWRFYDTVAAQQVQPQGLAALYQTPATNYNAIKSYAQNTLGPMQTPESHWLADIGTQMGSLGKPRNRSEVEAYELNRQVAQGTGTPATSPYFAQIQEWLTNPTYVAPQSYMSAPTASRRMGGQFNPWG